MEEQVIEESEIQSEAVRDFLEQIPSWIIRWGIIVISLVILACFILSYYIKYPDNVTAPFKLTSLNAPKQMVAHTDGKLIRLLITEKSNVKKGQILAYLESVAKPEEVLDLELKLSVVELLNYENLGELQTAYQVFNLAQIQYISFKKDQFLSKRKAFLEKDLEDLKKLHKNLLEQLAIQNEDLALAENELNTQRKLFSQRVIPSLELKREESKYINKQLPIKNLEASLISNSTAQTSKQRELMELDKTISEQESIYEQAKITMKSAIEAWKQKYLIVAATDGTIFFNGIIEEKMQVSTNQVLFYSSTNSDTYFGQVQIPQINFGKVKIGQKVLIKFDSYPYQEFGMVEGVVEDIAENPTSINNAEIYLAKIKFTKGLQTNFGKKVNHREGMTATAQIITEDLRLIERLFYQIRKAILR